MSRSCATSKCGGGARVRPARLLACARLRTGARARFGAGSSSDSGESDESESSEGISPRRRDTGRGEVSGDESGESVSVHEPLERAAAAAVAALRRGRTDRDMEARRDALRPKYQHRLMPIKGRGRFRREADAREHHASGQIKKFVALRRPEFERALALLRDIGNAVAPLMLERHWSTCAAHSLASPS